jgi:hypothetical protein
MSVYYLLIANQTLDSPALHDWVARAVDSGNCRFHVVVPASRVEHRFTWTEGEALALARRRLDDALLDFSALGVAVEGEVGDENPVLAAADAMRQWRYDAIVVSTLPSGASRWLKLDVVSRLRRETNLPVIHVEAPALAKVG